ncbi:hypothetical protein Lser_V15G25181 [Lactuca serriola]
MDGTLAYKAWQDDTTFRSSKFWKNNFVISLGWEAFQGAYMFRKGVIQWT